MRVYTKYRATSGTKCKWRGATAAVIALLLLLGVSGWFAWKYRFTFQNNAASPGDIAHETSATNSGLVFSNAAINSTTSSPSTKPESSSPKPTVVLNAQIALDRLGISPGSIDGVIGSQTRTAIRTFQMREGLPQTGELGSDTRGRLPLSAPALTTYAVTASDIARLLPLGATWLAKSEQPRLDYETLLELIAEKAHAHPNLIRRLNPSVDWSALATNAAVTVPFIERERPTNRAALIQIKLSARTLQAFDGANRLLAHFPCSIAARMDKRPVGELRVAVIAPNPNYMFDPENFPESAEARDLGRKLRLEPGPNNPVGTVWIGLDKAGYGIHGTPKPEDVGRTESHGCFRLANWNAEFLLQFVNIGTPVRIEP